MKILTSEQMRLADDYTIANEPVESVDLMERAAETFVQWFGEEFSDDKPVHIFCGTGNNGGDGLAIGRLLNGLGYKVNIYILRVGNRVSNDFQINEDWIKKISGIKVKDVAEPFPEINDDEIIIDALFGTGLSRPLEGRAAALVEHLNKQPATRVSVDIPSGLYSDRLSPSVKFHAHHTFTFELPKLSFLFPENEESVGLWYMGSIGLHPDFINAQPVANYYITNHDITLKIRPRFSHKGFYGHALLISGSFGKIGAAILSANAALKSGAGLVTLFTPRCGYSAVQSSIPEAMVICSGEELIDSVTDISKFNAIGIGPGIGTDPATAATLHQFITQANRPLVIDADALNILAKFPSWLEDLPEGSILTPHPKEFERLFGPTENSYDRLELLRNKACEYGLHIILKGANTAVASPDGIVWFNSTGNAGMATGGAGDVLTGIITGLLAQRYEPLQAAITGVYLHGLAGDIAALENGMEALVAGDIIRHLGAAFLEAHTVNLS